MTDKPENPQVYPVLERLKAGDVEMVTVTEKGLTLRDHFAGEALAGMLANDAKHQKAKEHLRLNPTALKGQTIAETMAQEAYSYADAMLKERAK